MDSSRSLKAHVGIMVSNFIILLGLYAILTLLFPNLAHSLTVLFLESRTTFSNKDIFSSFCSNNFAILFNYDIMQNTDRHTTRIKNGVNGFLPIP